MSVDRTHDIEIVTSQGRKYSFMLAGTGGQKLYEVRDLSLLPPSLITGEASYANMSPEQKILLEATDWRRGIQDEIFETEGKYYRAKDCDLRFKGKAMLPPKELTALSLETIPDVSIKDPDLEDWTTDTDLTEWVETGDGVKKTTVHHKGSYGAYQSVVSSAGLSGSIYQDLTWDNTFRNKCFTFGAWGYRAKPTDAPADKNWVMVSINDGVETADSPKCTASSWEYMEVKKKLASNATRLRVIVSYQVAGDGTSSSEIYFDDTSLPLHPHSGAVKKISNFGSDLCVACGDILYNLSDGNLVSVQNFPEAITDLCVFKNRLYIALGWSTKYFYTSDLSTFTQCTLDNATAKYMANIGNKQFWISDTSNTLRDSDNPVNGGTAFSTPYTLPNSDYKITGLVDDIEVVYVRKQDQVYYLSGSDANPLIPDLAAEASTEHSYGIYPWKGKLYLPSGENSLYEYDNGDVRIFSPCRYAKGDTDLDGKILALASDQEYLYIAVDNGDKIEILAGHWEIIGGSRTWNWHWLYEKTSNDITCALISPVSGNKRFYLGTNTESDGILNYKIPVSYSDPLKESGYEVQSSGEFITPKLTTKFATTDKLWHCIRVTSLNFKSDTTIRVYYQTKGSDWISLGYCTQNDYTSTADPWSFTYPNETTDKFDIEEVSAWIRFKFALATTESKLSPIVKGYSVESRLVPLMSGEFAGKVEIELTIKAADNLQNLAGVSEPTKMHRILEDIEALKREALPFTITGPDQKTYTVRFTPRGSKRKPYIDEKTRHPEFWVSCLLQEV